MFELSQSHAYSLLDPAIFERMADYINGLCPYWVQIEDMGRLGE